MFMELESNESKFKPALIIVLFLIMTLTWQVRVANANPDNLPETSTLIYSRDYETENDTEVQNRPNIATGEWGSALGYDSSGGWRFYPDPIVGLTSNERSAGWRSGHGGSDFPVDGHHLITVSYMFRISRALVEEIALGGHFWNHDQKAIDFKYHNPNGNYGEGNRNSIHFGETNGTVRFSHVNGGGGRRIYFGPDWVTLADEWVWICHVIDMRGATPDGRYVATYMKREGDTAVTRIGRRYENDTNPLESYDGRGIWGFFSPFHGYWDDMIDANGLTNDLSQMYMAIDRLRVMPGWPDAANGPPTGSSPPDENLSENSYIVVNPSLVSASVVSLADNNVITTGDLSLNLNLYERGAFYSSTGPVLSPGTVITGTGPFDIGSGINGTDVPVHASMLGTSFAMPHTRYTHIYYMMSPNDDAMVTIDIDGENFQMDLPRGEVTEFNAGDRNGEFGAVITSDVPILVSHLGKDSTVRRDASPMPPSATELWGIRTESAHIIAVEDDTHVDLYASDGVLTGTMTLHAGQKRYVNVGLSGRAARQGAGSAVHLVSDKPISAVQIADGDGTEQTAFYPTHMLKKRFGIPEDSQYVAIVCAEPDTSVTLYQPDSNPETKTCSADGEYPGKVFFGRADANVASIQQGSYLESTELIHVIYEVTGSEDEHNMIGASETPLPLFSSDMEGSDPSSSWPDVRARESASGATITFVTDEESQVAQFNYRTGYSNNLWMRKNFGSHQSVNEEPVDELWINFEYKVSDTAIYNPNQNRSNKILLVNWSNPETNNRSFQVQLGAYHNGSAHVLGLEWAQFQSNGAWYHGQFLGFATTPIPTDEKLYLQLHIRNSTNGQANGIVELFNNGELIIEQRDVALNDSSGDHPDHFILTSYIRDANGLEDGFAQYDNVYLYATDPGPF